MLKRYVVAFILAGCLSLAGCSGTSNSVETDEVGTTEPDVESLERLARTRLDDNALEAVAQKITDALPLAEDAADIFMSGGSGEYVIVENKEILAQDFDGLATSDFRRGWTRSYELSTDLVGELRRIKATSQILVFTTRDTAMSFYRDQVRNFDPNDVGDVASIGLYGEPYFVADWVNNGQKLPVFNTAGSLFESVFLKTTFEDQYLAPNPGSNKPSRLDLRDTAAAANVHLWIEIVKKFSMSSK